VSDGREGLQNWLNMRCQDLREIILLIKGSMLARTMNKDQRTLITISDCPPSIDRSRVSAMKLVLYTRLAMTLPPFSCDLLLRSSPSN
jgi:hypothetical protein